MNPDKTKLIVALCIGIAIGLGISFAIRKEKDRYSIVVLNTHTSIRLDRQTGETWQSRVASKGIEWLPMDPPRP